MKNIILVGHSHTNCLFAELLDTYKEDYLTQRVHVLGIANDLKKMKAPLKRNLNDLVIEKINDAVKEFPKNGKLFSRNNQTINIILLLGGSFHHMLGLMKSEPPFDFVHPSFPDLELDIDAEVIPYNAIRKILSPDIKEHEKIVKSIIGKFSFNIIHLGFPPTVLNEDLMMSKIEPFFNEKYEKPKLAHHNLRFKLWRLYSDMYSEMCKTHNITFLQPPEIMIENKMFLKEEAYGDSMHANKLYAKKYIELFDSKLV